MRQMVLIMHHEIRYWQLSMDAMAPLSPWESGIAVGTHPLCIYTAHTRLYDPERQIEMLSERRLRPASRCGVVQQVQLMAEQLHLCTMPSHSRRALWRTRPGCWRLIIWSMLRMFALLTIWTRAARFGRRSRCGAHARHAAVRTRALNSWTTCAEETRRDAS